MLPLLHPEDIDKPRVLFALVHLLLIHVCIFHFKSCVIVTPRYLMESTFSRTVPSKVRSLNLICSFPNCLHYIASVYGKTNNS